MQTTVNKRLSATAIALTILLSACGGGGSSSDQPLQATIQSQPKEQTVVVNGLAKFSVQAVGDKLTYQWQRSTDSGLTWGDIAGATGAILEVSDVPSASDGYQYRVIIDSANGRIVSAVATLHVQNQMNTPVFIADLSDPAPVVAGSNVTLSVTASGANISYQWEKSIDGGVSWVLVDGNSPSLVVSGVSVSANGTVYRVKVSNSVGTLTSKTAKLTVTAAPSMPTVSTQPQSVSVSAPDVAIFTVVGSGNPEPKIQWQLSTDGGKNFADIAGGVGSSYSTGATTSNQNGYRYRAVLTNDSGTVYSEAAVLSVQAAKVAPTVTLESNSVSVNSGQKVTFVGTVAGTPTPSLQWQISSDSGKSWTGINGATSATYTINSVSISENGNRYRLVANNSAGTATSTPVILSVTSASSIPVISTQPKAVELIEGETAKFEVEASGPGTISYQWQVSNDIGKTFSDVVNGNGKSYSFTPSASESGKMFRVVVGNEFGVTTSASNTLVVYKYKDPNDKDKSVFEMTAATGYSVALDVNGLAAANKILWSINFAPSLSVAAVVTTASGGSFKPDVPGTYIIDVQGFDNAMKKLWSRTFWVHVVMYTTGGVDGLTPSELAKKVGCYACHAIDVKVVGPSFKAVAAKYSGKNGAEDELMLKIINGSRGGTWGPVPMPPVKLSSEQAIFLTKWILGM